ncbi:MAG: hypothetical protein EBY62_10890, partial [Cellvibrionales bacterium]|nr:hypothetical protein [Cellvibrionales bacterium]
KQVRVHLYSREGITVGSITGRVADIAEGVEVADGMKKDLVFVVDIDTGDFLEDATDAAVTLPADASVYDRLSAVFHLLERSFLLWLGAVALLVLI